MHFAWEEKKHWIGIIAIVILVCCTLIPTPWRENFSQDSQSWSASNYHRKWHDKTDTIIVTAHFKEDLAWLRKSPYPVVVCSKAGADKAALTPDAKCTMKFNRGREFGSYLKFIIEYYDQLPLYVAFIHGHETAWHQQLHIFDAIRCAKKKQFGYISLNNSIFPKLEWSKGNKGYDTHGIALGGAFQALLDGRLATLLLPRLLRAIHRLKRPNTVANKGGLQALVRSRISSIQSDYDLGLGFEMIWPLIFGEPTDIMISPHEYKESRFACNVRDDVASRRVAPYLQKVYIVIMVTEHTRSSRANLKASYLLFQSCMHLIISSFDKVRHQLISTRNSMMDTSK
jgi:hypothetical protein